MAVKSNVTGSEKIRIRLKAYDHVILEQSADHLKWEHIKELLTFFTQHKKQLIV